MIRLILYVFIIQLEELVGVVALHQRNVFLLFQLIQRKNSYKPVVIGGEKLSIAGSKK